MTHARQQRRGAAMMVLVLTCLLVITALAGSMTAATLRSRRAVRSEHQLRQSELLLEAGVLRAASQLQNDPAYSGETWQPAATVGRFSHPLVDIQVTAATDDQTARLVEVTASLGTGVDASDRSGFPLTRRSHTFRFTASSSPNPESSQ